MTPITIAKNSSQKNAMTRRLNLPLRFSINLKVILRYGAYPYIETDFSPFDNEKCQMPLLAAGIAPAKQPALRRIHCLLKRSIANVFPFPTAKAWFC